MDSAEMTMYRGCTPVIDATYDQDADRSPAETVVDALSEASGADPTELPPLYEFVDPDALDRLFDRDGSGDTVLSFRVHTWNVFVRDDGRVRVCDATERIEPEPVFDSASA
jgi:hypothetical protein